MASLDEQKLSLLRAWGAGLERDEREEVAAAGRAILLLVEEVEQLHVELWHARKPAPAEEHEHEPEPPAEEPEAPDVPEPRASLGAALRHRLRNVAHFRAE